MNKSVKITHVQTYFNKRWFINALYVNIHSVVLSCMSVRDSRDPDFKSRDPDF